MTLEEKLDRRQKEGYAEGHTEGHEEGYAEGHVEGHAEGQSEAHLEVAKNLKNKGIDLAVICECTGLSEDEVDKL